MSGEQILLLVILAIAIWGSFALADEWREIFAEDESYGDSPFIHPEMRGNGAADRNSRGRKAASGSDPSHKHDIAHRDEGSTR